MSKAYSVDMAVFDQIIDQHPLIILDFWAEGCGPCKVFGPIFEKLAEAYPDIYFGKVNTEVATDLAQAFQIRSIPTLMAFKNGDLVFEHSGLLPPESFDQLIQKLKASSE